MIRFYTIKYSERQYKKNYQAGTTGNLHKAFNAALEEDGKTIPLHLNLEPDVGSAKRLPVYLKKFDKLRKPELVSLEQAEANT